ncbi:MAG: aminotransferase class I/II-fold pyridoxal phosphate-dependent enzyme [Lachnospiraceae bacterium]|nr:aminotransferase class I/II-fold pyridoxal phosphate-dependent enzyme [Lachnospiraceae bacterium]
MERYGHGGDIYSREIIYDFSASINPLGLPDGVRQALTEGMAQYEKYPDPRCRALVQAISDEENVPEEYVVCGNGASELLYKLLQVKRPKRVLLASPCFVEYEKAVIECGADVCYYERKQEQQLRLDEGILSYISDRKKNRVDMVILCSPNNPNGDVIAPGLMSQIINRCIEYGITLVIDQCFIGFVDMDVYPQYDNIIVLKAFTKLYAMAGLRLGYMLSSDTEMNQKIWQTGQCWSVSVPAQLAGLAALKEKSYVEQTRKVIRKERMWLAEMLSEIGLKVYPSEANFLLVYSQLALADALEKKGIAIRDCSNFKELGEGYYRIAVRGHAENAVLVREIGNIYGIEERTDTVWQKQL